jgi:hypothetical protein
LQTEDACKKKKYLFHSFLRTIVTTLTIARLNEPHSGKAKNIRFSTKKVFSNHIIFARKLSLC